MSIWYLRSCFPIVCFEGRYSYNDFLFLTLRNESCIATMVTMRLCRLFVLSPPRFDSFDLAHRSYDLDMMGLQGIWWLDARALIIWLVRRRYRTLQFRVLLHTHFRILISTWMTSQLPLTSFRASVTASLWAFCRTSSSSCEVAVNRTSIIHHRRHQHNCSSIWNLEYPWLVACSFCSLLSTLLMLISCNECRRFDHFQPLYSKIRFLQSVWVDDEAAAAAAATPLLRKRQNCYHPSRPD